MKRNSLHSSYGRTGSRAPRDTSHSSFMAVVMILLVLLVISSVRLGMSLRKDEQITNNYYICVLPDGTTTKTTILPTETILPSIPDVTQAVVPPRYGFTEDEIYLLAQLICGDASNDGDGEYDFVWQASYGGRPHYYEMSKVLCVIMNRQRSGYWSSDVREIVLQPGQFTPMPKNLDTTPDPLAIEEIRKWCQAYDAYDPEAQVIPETHMYFSSGPNLTNITRENYK